MIEYRLVSDAGADPCLSKEPQARGDTQADMTATVRLSIGLEDLEDLKNDFRQAFKAVATKASQ